MIREHITNHILKKLEKAQSLVMYDPEQRYTELLPALSSKTKVVDLRESLLACIDEAYRYFNNELPGNPDKTLLVYSPFKPPLDDQAKIEDPFFIFTQGVNYFPFGASDRYDAMCLACFPDKEQQLADLFATSIPDLDTIDALGGGNSYAQLQSATGGKSEKEIIRALLIPNDSIENKLKSDKNWLNEWKKLSLDLGFKSATKNFEQVNEELWRILLFSEFVFDLPVPLPEKYKSSPVFKQSAKALVFELLKSIRNDKSCESLYVEKANQVEKQLALANEFRNKANLGEIVTFAFEDNTFFNLFVSYLIAGNWSQADSIIRHNKENIWPQHDEERRKMWLMAEYALRFGVLTSVEDKLPSGSVEIVALYASKVYQADQLHRRYEMLLNQLLEAGDAVDKITAFVRDRYRNYTAKWQKAFQASIKHWPLEGIPSNIQLFDRLIAPMLKEKKKIAYILVDALRFELGKELEESLAKQLNAQVTPYCAFVPTVTKYGMAALLPNASKNYSLLSIDGKLEAHIDGTPLPNLQSRRLYLKDKLGDRCSILSLEELLSSQKIESDLLVITTNEIDAAGENLTINALSAISQSIQNLIRGIVILRKWGYTKMVIATDHGFMLHPDFKPGDNVSKPVGDWSLVKSRCLAGKGHSPNFTLSFSPTELGFQSDAQNFVFLKNYAVFEKNLQFFHQGLSLQETIIPVIEVTIPKIQVTKSLTMTLAYRGKSFGSITTRRPVIDLSCFQQETFGFEPVSVKLEAIASDKIVGLPIASEFINEMTKLADILPGGAYKIPFEMEEDYEGEFDIVATDPVTNTTHATLHLSTDYM